ncbi:hypothetical protein ACEWK1_02875 [Metabacillus sp. YM-086]|uniref:hypothetical protein n=1 Tax=Metabacillus sp. YM-086 TaxID=3341729 RepID=UPI003A84F884
MGCLKSFFKLILILGFSIVAFLFFLGFLFNSFSSNESTEISNQIYSDSQELLNLINEEFLFVNTSERLDEENVNRVLDYIEEYGLNYKNEEKTVEEQELYDDIGKIVYDYMQLIQLETSYEDIPLSFNERFYYLSGSKRDIYQMFLEHRKSLREIYGFEYKQ